MNFSLANPSSYSLTEICPFSSINGGADEKLGFKFDSFIGGLGDNRDEESSVTEHSGGGQKPRDGDSDHQSSKLVTTGSGNDLGHNKLTRKRTRISGTKDVSGGLKVDGEAEQNRKLTESRTDYIHVRARRGQATDSHSLAERARREKISERMKTLEDLVPGCNKVIGKALVLDEIINYIQSLQQQVELLTMKLEAVNTTPNSLIEGLPTKELGPPPFDASGLLFGSQTTREYGQESQPEWLHMQLGSSFEKGT